MEKSDSIQNLAKALSSAQGEMPPAPMNATNPFLKNKYADLGAMVETAKPVLKKHGLSISQIVEGNAEKISVVTLLMHESGEWLSGSISLTSGEERGKSQAQVAGSIVTYLRRYSFASILGMYADEDTDGTQPNHKQEQPRKAAPPPDDIPVVERPAPTNGKTHEQPGEPEPEWNAEAVAKLATEYNQHPSRIKNALAYCTYAKPATYDLLADWMKMYREGREDGMTPQEAGEYANVNKFVASALSANA